MRPRSAKSFLDREERGLHVQRVEDGLGEQEVDAAVEQPARLLVVGVDELVEGDVRAPGSLTSGDIDAVRFVGPSAPATQVGRLALGRDRIRGRTRAVGPPARLIS